MLAPNAPVVIRDILGGDLVTTTVSALWLALVIIVVVVAVAAPDFCIALLLAPLPVALEEVRQTIGLQQTSQNIDQTR